MRIAVCGTGHVGATAAYALMLRALFDEIVLIDNNAALARAEAADLSDANALARPAHIWAGDYADAASATIAVITAGAATHGDETRLSVASRSALIMEQCVAGLIGAGFAGIIVVAANPVDLMSFVAFRASGFPATKVIGTGTLLDSARLRRALSQTFGIAPTAVEALVLGEHGDSEVPAFSQVRIGGIALPDFAAGTVMDQASLAASVRSAGYDIIAGKGYTSFGIATAIVRICEAIVRGEHAVLPVSTLLTGEFGIRDLYLSLPCIIGREGIERILMPDLSPQELSDLKASAAILADAIKALSVEHR